MTWRSYSLTVGLPHTNARGFAEARLLMEAGHFFWQALGEELGRPVAELRSARGRPVYATIAYVEENVPEDRDLGSFRLDDRLRFLVGLRSGGPLAMEARVVFDREDALRLDGARQAWSDASMRSHPRVRFGSLFASPSRDGQGLELAVPVNIRPAPLSPVPQEESPVQITRQAQETGELGVVPQEWASLDSSTWIASRYAIDPDRDTNLTGLVYFANYVAFLELGERQALCAPATLGSPWSASDTAHRRLWRRRIAYVGNAAVGDLLTVAVARFASPDPRCVGLRSRVTRESDGKLLCLSESVVSRSPLAPLSEDCPLEVTARRKP